MYTNGMLSAVAVRPLVGQYTSQYIPLTLVNIQEYEVLLKEQMKITFPQLAPYLESEPPAPEVRPASNENGNGHTENNETAIPLETQDEAPVKMEE